jgi:teichoic acid transport system permease protein
VTMFRRAAVATADEDSYLGEHHVYEPHRSGLPKLSLYFKELWLRREFVLHLSKTNLRAQSFDTVLGQIWLVLNPLLLATVYFMLVDIVGGSRKGPEYFAHLVAGLFAFYFISGSMNAGAGSVVGGGRLILNTAFPRALLPFSATLTAFYRFLPTMLVYAVLHLLAGKSVGLVTLWIIPIAGIMFVFGLGLAMFFAALQVYFRDVASFLPYFIRIWLYTSPVILTMTQINAKAKGLGPAGPLFHLNPLFYILGSWNQVLDDGKAPGPGLIGPAVLAAAVTLVLGGLFFISREREFAVRL